MDKTRRAIPITILLMLAGAGLLGAADTQAPADAFMSAEERARAVTLLEGSRNELLELVEGLDAEAMSFKPGADRWSIGEVVEHVLRTEELFLPILEEAVAGAPNPEWKAQTAGKGERVESFMGDRSTKVEAPSGLAPKGELAPAELLDRYTATRDRCLRFARETELPIKRHTFDHPGFGTLNAHQWLLFFALHNQRHNQQIVEIKSSPGFPA